ncbi:MAG: helix-turn-helix domain-containing protein [Oscillospiraceae bacterium]
MQHNSKKLAKTACLIINCNNNILSTVKIFYRLTKNAIFRLTDRKKYANITTNLISADKVNALSVFLYREIVERQRAGKRNRLGERTMYNVMIVDDHRVFMTQIKRLSVWEKQSSAFFLKFLKDDSTEALEELKNNPVDILITDIKMPKLNGFDLIRAAKENNLCRCAIVMSQFAEFEYAREALICGALDYLVKPVSNNMMSAALDKAYEYLGNKKEPYRNKINVLAQNVAKCIIDGGEGFEHRLSVLLELCMVSTQKLDNISSNIYSVTVSEICETVFENYPWLREIVPGISLITERIVHADNDAASANIVKEYLTELKGSLCRYYPSGMNALTQNIVNYMLANIRTDFSLEDVSKACYINKTHLSHIFKQNMGISFVNYITNYKMQHLKKMLNESELKLSELAENLGFDDYKYMGRLFKKIYGVSPSEYRKYIQERGGSY